MAAATTQTGTRRRCIRPSSAAAATDRSGRWCRACCAPVQFFVFLVSLVLVLRYLATGEGRERRHGVGRRQDADALRHHGHRLHLGESGLRPLAVRPGLLLGRRVQHAGAGAAHGLSGGAVHRRAGARAALMLLALAAYATYVINATQFLLKLRAARLDGAGNGGRARSRGGAMNARHPAAAAAAERLQRRARCCTSAASAKCSAA